MTVVTDAITLARKDVTVELRAREAVPAGLGLVAIALALVGLAVGPDRGRLTTLAPAVVWIALLYASLAVAERLDRIDRADDAFTGLWLSLEDRRALYLGRILSLALFLTFFQVVLWGSAAVVFDLALDGSALLIAPLSVLSALSLAATTALVMALVGAVRDRTLLLPVALLPLLVPTFLASVQASTAVLAGRPSDGATWAAILVIESALFLGLGLLTYETAASPD